MSIKRGGKQSRFIRYIKGPIWLLARVRDLSVQSLTGSGGHVSYGNAMGCPAPQIPSLPRSYSVSSSGSSFRTAEDELRDFRRDASTAKIQRELRRSKSVTPPGGGAVAAVTVPRSRTVGFGRIDEDKVLDFGED